MITVNKDAFKNAVNILKLVVKPTSPQLVLRGVLLNVSDSCFTLTGCSGDVSIVTQLNKDDYKTDQSAKLLVGVDYLDSILQKVDGDQVKITIEGYKAQLSCGSAKFKLNGMNPNDYPLIDFTDWDLPAFDLNNAEFLSYVNKTIFAVANKNNRPVLAGVNFTQQDGNLFVTATDGYRLSTLSSIRDMTDFNVTVPADSLKVISKVLPNDANQSFRLAIDNTKIILTSDNTTILSRLCDGTYPKVENLIPSDFNTTITVNRKDLIAAINRGSIFKTDRIPVFKMRIDESHLILTSQSTEYGDFYEDLPISSDGSFETTVSGIYMMDALKALDGDIVSIKFVGDLKPFIIQDVEPASNQIELLLPIRTYN